MPTQDIRKQVALALEAVNNKKAEDVALLQLPGESSTFTDYFLICSGSNPRQVQAIADEVDERLSKDMGIEPNAREGYNMAEWILLDYVDFVVHIFNAQRRAYYDLERLWKSAHKLTAQELLHPPPIAAVEFATEGVPVSSGLRVKKPAKKAAAKKATSVRAAAKQSARGAKAAPRKVAIKKTAAKKTVAKKTAVKKASAKKTAGKKAGAKKTATKKTTAKKSSAKRK